ncbi:MAG: hypothetical protein V1773_11030 [bacterium]
MRITISMFMLLLFSIVWGCNSTEPNKTSNQNIELTFVDAASIEAWVEINTKNVTLPAKLTFTKNDKYAFELNLSKADTIICLDSLMPKTNYTIEAATNEKNSNKLTFETLDTTSHNFTWETFEFDREYFACFIFDVAIIDENNIWAGGEVYMTDSAGNQETEFYNIVKWNGSVWKEEKIYYNYQGQNWIASTSSIYAFSTTDVWIGGNQPMHWNGTFWKKWDLLEDVWYGNIRSIGASSSSNIYICGDLGYLAYYNGTNWKKLETGTVWDIYDVFGYKSYDNSKEEVICATIDPAAISENIILKITDQSKVERINANFDRFTLSIWTNKGFPIYTCGDGLFSNKSGKWEEINLSYRFSQTQIRGNGLNDIFVTGGLGAMAHYNGSSWKGYNDLYRAIYTAAHVKGNIIAMVGWSFDGKGIITIGKRY